MLRDWPYHTTGATMNPKIAILIPCYNEELTVGQVVREFRQQLPSANIYVFDNNSSDRTVEVATEAGAKIAFEPRQGKGYVVQTMFREVDADIYVMVDGDDTYPPSEVHKLIAPIAAGTADMAVGSRLTNRSDSDFRPLNRFGNRFFRRIINLIFKVKLTDILSGYRVFNRKFAKTIPIFGGGFETEAELTIKALAHGYRIVEMPVDLKRRRLGSYSKIRILQDGLLILNMILTLFRDYKPLTFFGLIGLSLISVGLVPGTIASLEFLRTGSTPRLPAVVLAIGMGLSGLLAIVVGIVLHTIARRFQELDHQLKILAFEGGRTRDEKAASTRC
jgi:glycosyltransferase involved in cell wall biosynthesis